jgi:hypothetical protein
MSEERDELRNPFGDEEFLRKQARLMLKIFKEVQEEEMLQRMHDAPRLVVAPAYMSRRRMFLRRVLFSPIAMMLVNVATVVLLGLMLWRLW